MNNITSQHGGSASASAASKILRVTKVALMLGFGLGGATQASAQILELPLDLTAPQACNFDLRIDGNVAPNRVYKKFYDEKGNIVRTLEAGKGNRLTFSHLGGASTYLMSPSGGSVNHTTINPDNTQTVTLTGHNVLIMFPSDFPAGPTTTLYVGRVVYTVDLNGAFHLVSTKGAKPVDICAALAN